MSEHRAESLLSRFRGALREQGTVTLGFRGLASFVNWMTAGRLRIVWYLFVAQPVRNDWRVPAKLGRMIATRILLSGDPLLNQAPRPSSVIADRFAQGSICIAAEQAGRLVGFVWLCPSEYREDDVRCVFVLPTSGDIWWDYDVWIQPDQRNGVVFAKLWQAAHEYLRQMAGCWTFSRITRANVGSLAAHRRLGATTIGHAVFICGRRWQVTISKHPIFHLSRSSVVTPRLHIRPPDRSTNVRAAIPTRPHDRQ